MSYHPQSILAIDASTFCRSLAMLPSLRALRVAYPRARLAVAASKAACELVSVSGLGSETIDLGVSRSGDHEWFFAVKSLIKLSNVVRRGGFDLVLGFSAGIETQIALRVGRGTRLVTPSKTPYLIDYLFGARGGSRRPGDHAAECASVLKQLGLKIDEEHPLIVLPDSENNRFEQLLARRGSRGGEPIVVLYGSASTLRQGSAVECLGEVAGRLASNFGARIVAVDEPLSRVFTDRIGESLPAGSISVASPRALEAAAAIARASLVITFEEDLVYLSSEFRSPMLEVRFTGGRSTPGSDHRVVSGASGGSLADDVVEAASEMLQRSRFPSLFQR